jgi:hypothetical protein
VANNVTKPLCILGGWAVYFTVNDRFKNATGRDYHGSKDIDLGFHMRENETDDSIQNSTLAQSVRALESVGFTQISFRLVQRYHRETRQLLSEEESKRIPIYNLFDLYVDPMVDRIPPNIEKIIGFTPPDEPLLKEVFEKNKYAIINKFGAQIILPNPEVLLSTKLNSLPNRQKNHKKIKDLADIYALIWHSGLTTSDLQHKVIEITGSDEFEAASNAIGVEKTQFVNIVTSFMSKTGQI